MNKLITCASVVYWDKYYDIGIKGAILGVAWGVACLIKT